MKILELKIFTPSREIKRKIEFKETGVSIILADIKRKDKKKETINSLGKTLLLKMIDYLYASNNDKYYFKDELNNYIIEGKIKFNNESYLCSRTIGMPDDNTINGKSYSLSEYKDFFSIKRSFLDKQVFFDEKNSLISSRQNPSCNDYLDVLTLLNLKELGEKASGIYKIQDSIKKLKKSLDILMNSYSLEKPRDLQEEIFLIDKRVEEYEEKLENVTEKIESIQILDLKENVLEEFAVQNSNLKKVKRKLDSIKIEKDRLENYIITSSKTEIQNEDVMLIYDRAKIEIPDMVKKEFSKVQEFHNKVYLERKEYLLGQIKNLEKSSIELEDEYRELTDKVNKLGKLISENEAYKESVKYYEKFTKDLNELKYRQGQLVQLKNINNEIDSKSNRLTKEFGEIKILAENNRELIEVYTDFIYDFVKLIYSEGVDAFFDIKIKERHLTRRPIELELKLRGDTGEGVGNVKKLLIDYLIFCYNKELEILIQDSSCYNGIDPRQVTSMIKEVDKLAKDREKQAIISLNRYQLIMDNDIDDFLHEKSSLILSENENLLGFSF